MAVTAKQPEYLGFDSYYYETARKLALASSIGRLAIEESFDGVEQRKTDEVIDGIAEAIPGIVKNVRSYETVNGVLVAEDGKPMEKLLLSGLKHSIKLASNDSFLASFGPARARYELDEARLWQKMVNGETGYNTVQVFSPYSEEYSTEENEAKLQLAGQEPKSKRAMLRIAHWDGRQLHILTRSIDNSSVDTLKAAAQNYDGFNYNSTNSTDMLGERRGANMNKGEVFKFANGLVEEADKIISYQIGEQTYQGRPVSEAHDTQKYVQSQTIIINNLMKISKELAGKYSNYGDYKCAWEKELFKYTALIKERMLRNDDRAIVNIAQAASASGAAAEARGESYNMCGTIISANGQPQPGEGTGFDSVKNLIGKKVTCPECKEKVVVPTSKIQEGRLCCPDCKYEVDVCTGEVYSKSHGSRKKTKSEEMSIADTIVYEFRKDMKRIDRAIAQKNDKPSARKKAA